MLPKSARIIVVCLAVLALLACGPAAPATPAASAATTLPATPSTATTLTIASTTSTYDSGLFDYVLPPFEKSHNVKIKVVAVGSGEALELGKRGDADLLARTAPKTSYFFVAVTVPEPSVNTSVLPRALPRKPALSLPKGRSGRRSRPSG